MKIRTFSRCFPLAESVAAESEIPQPKRPTVPTEAKTDAEKIRAAYGTDGKPASKDPEAEKIRATYRAPGRRIVRVSKARDSTVSE